MGKEHDVQARIDYKKIKAVMGWDIGDGDSVAFGRRMEKDGKLEPLYLHKSRDQQVEKTAVTRTDKGNIIIGEDVARQKEFEINFKRAPGKWNNKSGAMNMEYKQLMFDYIRGVSEAILQNSSNRDGTILKTLRLRIPRETGNGKRMRYCWLWAVLLRSSGGARRCADSMKN